MELIHTSPTEIKEIDAHGLFNDCLFFSSTEYHMSRASIFTYKIEISENRIIEDCSLDDDETITQIVNALSIDRDTAQDLLNSKLTAGDITGDYEDGWFIQAMQGQAAKNMGYLGCESEDEQGCVYIVPMNDRLSELKLTTKH